MQPQRDKQPGLQRDQTNRLGVAKHNTAKWRLPSGRSLLLNSVNLQPSRSIAPILL
jgi:hypothetical protein